MPSKIIKSFFAAFLFTANVYSMEVEESPTQSMDVETRPVEQVSNKRNRQRYENGPIRQSPRLLELARRNYKVTINDLPNEIIHQIFSYLDLDNSLDARMVNTRFLRCSLRTWDGELREDEFAWLYFYPRLTEIRKIFNDFSKWNKPFGHWLSNNSSLTTLDIGGSKIGPVSTEIIINALWNNTTLKTLDLENNNIGGTGARLILNFLENNTTLKTLSLRGNNIYLKPMQKNLENALLLNTTLTDLDLGENDFYCINTGTLVEAINRNTSLLTLGLDDIGFDPPYKGLILGEILENNITLTSLSFAANYINTTNNNRIAQALEKNSTLKELYLGFNTLGGSLGGHLALQEIFEGLTKNTSLTILNLQSNLIHEPHSKIIAEMLEINTTLEILQLDDNYIFDEGAQVIAQTLWKNTSLRALCLDGNPISPEVQKKLKEQWGDRIYLDEDLEEDVVEDNR